VADFTIINVIIKEEELIRCAPPNKPKKFYDISWKCWDVWATQFPWAKMLKSAIGKVHCVKCMVCSFAKGKDVILRPKANTLEKHARKTRVI
jgi:hypothetical protein